MDKTVSGLKKGLKGEIIIPADKSITHRAVMLASLSDGKVKVSNYSKGADCLSTIEVFKNLGVDVEIYENELIINSDLGLFAPKVDLDCGNSGTTMRLMSGILAGQKFNSVLIGDESLSKRPMARIIEPLSLMGAKIFSENNKAPLKITGEKLYGINYNSKLASAQVKSAVLFAGLNAEGFTAYKEPYLSRNHTELMLKYLDADIISAKNQVTIKKSKLVPKNLEIVGDISSAAFFIVAGLIVPNSDIIIRNVGLNPTRCGILEVVQKMGGEVEILDKKVVSNEEVGDLRVRYSELKSCIIEGEIIPRLIDELPVIAVLATQAEGETIIKNAEDLRNKEADRIKVIVEGLQKIGADIKETPDGFIVCGKTDLKGDCELDIFHDHRVAMSFYIAGLITEKPILIKEFEWTNISFPEFERLIDNLI
jgi:3-phosphoshikimate 1-carboxyvinyltransferase